MEKINRTSEVYISFDGKEFDTKEECQNYENDIELTKEEVIEYMKVQGTGIDETQPDGVDESQVGWWLKHPIRREQLRETVRNNYDLIDFDEWQAIQNILFKDSDSTITYKTALKINCALWEEDITPLDLERNEDQKVYWVTVYRDLTSLPQEDDNNLACIVVPAKWLIEQVEKDGVNFDEWRRTYTADETIDIYHNAVKDGVVMLID